MDKPIQENDVVQILENPYYFSLISYVGIAKQVMYNKCALVYLKQPTMGQSRDYELFNGTVWYLPWKYLKVLESPYGDKLGEAEEQIRELQSKLMFANSLIGYEEDVRDRQYKEIDILRNEVQELKRQLGYGNDEL